ncbi:hypothetical protein ACF91D_30765, partial [Staphylococcus sp. 231237_7MaSpsaltlick]|uniref:hypothetical protein n=1 Tax=Staphylococcus sp. 231237_7MaSpsaltlick TaxID=3367518 RepID=UPI00370B55BA
TTATNVINNHLSYRYGSIIEEIYNQGLPSKKYAAGLLYPTKHTLNTVEEDDNDENEKELQVDLNNKQVNNDKNEEETNEVSISGSEMYKQSTMGITFAIPEDVNTLKVKFECGHYKLKTNYNTNLQSINGYNKNWWMRRGLESEIDITTNQNKNIEDYELNLKDKSNLDVEELDVILYSNIRKIKNNSKIVTLTIENRTNNNSDNTDEQILFQSDLEVTIKDKGYFLPYPKPSELDINIGKEEKKFEFLYLDEKNYSFGHDCATLWEKDESNEVYKIKSSFLPEYEVKTMTPDIIIDNQELC